MAPTQHLFFAEVYKHILGYLQRNGRQNQLSANWRCSTPFQTWTRGRRPRYNTLIRFGIRKSPRPTSYRVMLDIGGNVGGTSQNLFPFLSWRTRPVDTGWHGGQTQEMSRVTQVWRANQPGRNSSWHVNRPSSTFGVLAEGMLEGGAKRPGLLFRQRWGRDEDPRTSHPMRSAGDEHSASTVLDFDVAAVAAVPSALMS